MGIYGRCNSYEECIEKLKQIKDKMDYLWKQNKIGGILGLERAVDVVYEDGKKFAHSPVDRANRDFLTFNYAPCKVYIALAKNETLSAITYFLHGVKALIDVSVIQSPMTPSVDYYKGLFGDIQQYKPDLLKDHDIFCETLRVGYEIDRMMSQLQHSEIKIEAAKLMASCFINLGFNLSEIYNEGHVEKYQRIFDLVDRYLDYVPPNSEESLNRQMLEFAFYRRKLYFSLRQLIPVKTPPIERDSIIAQIEQIIQSMQKTVDKEKRIFRKLTDLPEQRKRYKELQIHLDEINCKYYQLLYIEGDIPKALRKLNEIFTELKKYQDVGFSIDILQHFVDEYLLVSSFLKLKLVAQEMKHVGDEFKRKYSGEDWRAILFNEVADKIDQLMNTLFKYSAKDVTGKEILVAQTETRGRVTEFVIFYLLREIMNRKDEVRISKLIQSEPKEGIKALWKKLLQSKYIGWGEILNGKEVDLTLEFEDYQVCSLITIKTGLLSGGDLNKFKGDIELAEKLHVPIFIVADITRNWTLQKETEKIKEKVHVPLFLIDLEDILRRLLEIAKQHKEIPLPISHSTILSIAGIYT